MNRPIFLGLYSWLYQIAAQFGQVEVCKLLIAEGADLQAYNFANEYVVFTWGISSNAKLIKYKFRRVLRVLKG